MSTDVALIGDTHLYSEFSTVPDWIRERIELADHTIHCGDFVSGKAYNYFRELTTKTDGEFTAVRGNSDLITDEDLPDVAVVQIDDVRFVVTHPIGIGDVSLSVDAYKQAIIETVLNHDGHVGIAGHTHQIIDVKIAGTRIINPGSATAANPASEATMIWTSIDGNQITVRHLRAGETIRVKMSYI